MGATIEAIPVGVEVISEGLYYTDWPCSVCRKWMPRSTPAVIVTTRGGSSPRCAEHGLPGEQADEGEECDCHCHDFGLCIECGDESGGRW